MLSFIDTSFLVLSSYILITGPILICFRKFSPEVMLRLCNCGSYAYKGSNGHCVRFIEMPKSYYRHFYINASIQSAAAFLYMVCVYLGGVDVNEFIVWTLKALVGEKEPVCVVAAMSCMCLLMVQSLRRLTETMRLQVFAKASRMNLIHYLIGISHYTLTVAVILGSSPFFTGGNHNQHVWIDLPTTLLIVPCTLLFLWASMEQYRSHVTLANLRKDKISGKVLSEAYAIPRGRWFDVVSSPHRMFEIAIYVSLYALQRTDSSFYLLLWVVVNQIEMALLAHKWYKEEFKKYPSERKAIIPFLL